MYFCMRIELEVEKRRKTFFLEKIFMSITNIILYLMIYL